MRQSRVGLRIQSKMDEEGDQEEDGRGKWGTFPISVHVPLNKLECRNTGRRTKRQSEHPHHGQAWSSVHNYNTEMSRSRARKALALGEEGVGETKKGQRREQEPRSTCG